MADQNADRDLFNFGKVEGDINFSNQSPSSRSESEKDLLKEVRTRVEARLAGQLHHAVRLNLQKELQPKQVRPWSMEVKVAIEQPNQLLSPDTTIDQVFDRCLGRLLILGEPGAGKTTTLLDLAMESIARAEADSQARIPVIVDLSDWQPHPPQVNSVWSKIPLIFPWDTRKNAPPDTRPMWSIADWFVVKVQEKYGFPLKQIEQWVADRRLIPLLDGLDEVRPDYQQDCVRSISQWLKSDLRPREIAVCCRREQYEAYAEKLELEAGGAVYLQDLTSEQIQIFLSEANRSELWESLAADDNLLELIRRPLLLSMAIIAYQEIDRIHWQGATSAGDRINLLLDAYVRKMLTQDIPSRAYRKGKIPSVAQSQKWLEILALQLLQDSETDFLLEKMQPRWLSTPLQKLLYIFFLGLFYILISGLLGLAFKSTQVGIVCTLAGVILLLIDYFLIDDKDSIKPVGLMKNSLARVLKKDLWNELWNSFNWVIVLLPLICIFLNFKNGLIYTLTFSIFFTTSVVLFLIIILLSDVNFEHSDLPNSGVHNAIKNGFLTALVLSFTCSVCRYSLDFFSNTPASLQTFSIIILPWILSYSSLIGFVSGGGLVFAKHFILRSILICNRSTPINYVDFLNFATERLILQRVGGRYRFIHDLLRQTLAQHRINKYPKLINSKTFARNGESYYSAQQYDKALEDLDRAIQIDPKYDFAIMTRGRTYRAIERYNDSLQDFTKLIERNNKNAEALAGRGETYRWMERYEEALTDFNCDIQIDPKYDFAIISRGRTYRAIERYNDSLQDFTKLIELNNKNAEALAGRGETYRLMLRYEEALTDLNCVIQIAPKYAFAIGCRGAVCLMLGQYNEALKDLNSVIKLDSMCDFWFYHRSLTYFKLQQPDLAKIDLDIAIQIAQKKHNVKPGDCQNTFNLALYYLVVDEISNSREFYKIAFQHNPFISNIRDAIQDLEDSIEVLGNFPTATQMIEELKQYAQ